MPCDVSPVAMFLSNSPALGIVWGCRWPSEGIHTFYKFWENRIPALVRLSIHGKQGRIYIQSRFCINNNSFYRFGNVYFLFQFVILITIIIDETSVLAVISFLLAFTIYLLRFYILFCDSAILNSFTQFLFARVWTLLIGTRKKTEKLKKLRQFCKVKVNLIEATVANSIWKK